MLQSHFLFSIFSCILYSCIVFNRGRYLACVSRSYRPSWQLYLYSIVNCWFIFAFCFLHICNLWQLSLIKLIKKISTESSPLDWSSDGFSRAKFLRTRIRLSRFRPSRSGVFLEWNFLSHYVYLLLDKGIDSSSSSRNEHKRIKRRKSYSFKQEKYCKEISKQNNYKFQGRKKFFPGKKGPHPNPLPLNSKIKCSVPKQNRSGNSNNFYWSGNTLKLCLLSLVPFRHFVILSFRHFAISPFCYFVISYFKHAPRRHTFISRFQS